MFVISFQASIRVCVCVHKCYRKQLFWAVWWDYCVLQSLCIGQDREGMSSFSEALECQECNGHLAT